MNDQVVVGYLTGGQPEAAFVSSLTRLLGRQENRVVGDIQIISGPKIDKGRNRLFEAWLNETNADYFLMVDDDMVLPANTITRLMKHRKDIIGGLCFSVSLTGIMRPSIHIVEPNDEGKPVMSVMYDYPLDSVIKVDGTGGACMLVTRRCAKAVGEAMGDHPLKWFAHGMHNGIEIGEDVSFCLRAAKVGFETWVDTGLEIPHLKTRAHGQADYLRSLNLESHPYYDLREKVPLYQEYLGDNTSQHDHKPSSEGIPSPGQPGRIDLFH